MSEPTAITLVREFQDAFDACHGPEVSVKLIEEELKEVQEAAAHLLKEIADLMYVCVGAAEHPDWDEILAPDMPDWLLTLMEKAFTPEQMGVAFLRVHQSNMSKLDSFGKPVRREDGKVLKGLGYKPADLLDLVPLA
jgi:predicted HAD superfamily Cof-like phosphohydrolase